ncbi:uncharacterized protein isoform X2 [Castor canadensis]|uniref:Uncharacterized protein LOC109674839 isoform X2 n=1 Tax=Castor canadensis TaxID=51338 RepID=A0A8B7TKR9_CASCN|nr:uncharacterized protein LOC109674839 isoform X2 [Castor canadensis]
MAPASLDMNSAGLRARGGGGAGPSPLTFSVESLLEAERGLGSKTQEPGEERPQGAAEPGAWLPPVARACPPRKCPASRSRALRGRALCASVSFQVPPALHPAPSENTRTTASRGRPSPRRSCWRWSASSTRSSTCPLPSAPSSPAA